ncbi:helix-turn-helix DNA binding domain protein [Mycobacterium phage LittleE]|uniref:Helix-turn-helix DNA binding domain protein n=2 Tax=Omegavirus TaxID=1623292 RepID=Q854J6_BPMOM|nr:HTH DNA binding protein [Mycobacterium phage Omega]YP_009636976.1 HTH DNA binding protein [Mycobacterium phage LittleE]AAN12712.1 helix-turn-helix DNA binding domain protein [Mycobacterium phage Omega]AEK09448.1 helix-turn-helix DNA binding domain protein [Mycobacterium phage LittleE]
MSDTQFASDILSEEMLEEEVPCEWCESAAQLVEMLGVDVDTVKRWRKNGLELVGSRSLCRGAPVEPMLNVAAASRLHRKEKV